MYLSFLFSGCQNQTHGDSASPCNKEISTYTGGKVDIFYQSAKDRQKQLGLDSPENGFPDLQIGVWYDFAPVKEWKLIVITNKATNRTATVYDLQVDRNGKTETILSKRVRQAAPKPGWSIFSKKLLKLQIMTLPDRDDAGGYSAGDDGTTYSVEAATKNEYRFYSYWEPQKNKDKFWQAKNMTDISELLETELVLTPPE